MDGFAADAETGPSIQLQQLAAEPLEAPGYWRISWQLVNRSGAPLTVSGVGLPHGQFKADEIEFAPEVTLEAERVWRFSSNVVCAEPPGPVTENAFLIFRTTWSAASWRIFVRVRVVVSGEGKPHAATESVTTQKVGFSGVDS